ncbi:hypothetical protein GCM10009087_41230 [Sphingomonas oligophenolica]|uniref:hypothetical protein n=1 Tax=Sphingomonas oligophenolica TaxID=301154 RepID=UPI0031D631F6
MRLTSRLALGVEYVLSRFGLVNWRSATLAIFKEPLADALAKNAASGGSPQDSIPVNPYLG